MTTKDQLPPLFEFDFYQFQHDETGQTMLVDRQQVEWGFEANNPRLHKIGGAFTADQMHAYALAALAQQAQEPVALGLPIHNLRNLANGLRAVQAVDKRFIASRLDEIADYLRDLEQATPQPQPAPLAASAEDMAVYDGIAKRYFSDTKPAPLAGEVTDDLVRETIKAIQDPDTVNAFHNGYYTLTPEEVRRAILALRPQTVPVTLDFTNHEEVVIIHALATYVESWASKQRVVANYVPETPRAIETARSLLTSLRD